MKMDGACEGVLFEKCVCERVCETTIACDDAVKLSSGAKDKDGFFNVIF